MIFVASMVGIGIAFGCIGSIIPKNVALVKKKENPHG